MLWQEAGRSIGEYNVSRTMAKSERVKFIAAATTTRISKVTRYAVNIVAIYLGNYMHLEICFMVIPRLRQCSAFATYSFLTSVSDDENSEKLDRRGKLPLRNLHNWTKTKTNLTVI